jgi:rare lipoprotein A
MWMKMSVSAGDVDVTCVGGKRSISASKMQRSRIEFAGRGGSVGNYDSGAALFWSHCESKSRVPPKRQQPDCSGFCRCHEAREKFGMSSLKLKFLLGILMGALLVPTAGYSDPQKGVASIYSTREGTKTASGVRLNDGALTAAHKTLPFGTKVKVTNHKNGKSVVVTITDRGPFIRGRVIDLTPAGARALGFSGLTQVTLDIVG